MHEDIRKRKAKNQDPTVESSEQQEFDSLVKDLRAKTGIEVDGPTRVSLARAFEEEKGLGKNTVKIDIDDLADDMLPERDWIADEQLNPDEIKQYKNKRKIE